MIEGSTRLEELRNSARGWHGVQLAVLGFIGLCGVLEQGGGEGSPRWVQITAGLLILLALALSCYATALVASVAWPLYGSRRAAAAAEPDPAGVGDEELRTGQRLRTGIAITYLAVALTALAATSSWWPGESSNGASGTVEVQTRNGVACGEIRDSQPGLMILDTGGELVQVSFGEIVALRPVATCP